MSFIRSRARWTQQAEKQTKYVLNLESRNVLNKTHKNRTLGGEIIHKQSSILNPVKVFYEI